MQLRPTLKLLDHSAHFAVFHVVCRTPHSQGLRLKSVPLWWPPRIEQHLLQLAQGMHFFATSSAYTEYGNVTFGLF